VKRPYLADLVGEAFSPDDLVSVCEVVIAMRATYGPAVRPVLARLVSHRPWTWVERVAGGRVGHC